MSKLVQEAMSELRVALSQKLQSDDQIIMDHIAAALDLLERAEGPQCPECGSDDFYVQPYDFGRDNETGYSDSGERGICRKCGCNSDIGDFAPEQPVTSVRRIA
jgi:hypothetical protein